MQRFYPNTILYNFEVGDVVTIRRTCLPGDGKTMKYGFAERHISEKGTIENWKETIENLRTSGETFQDATKKYLHPHITMIITSISKGKKSGILYKYITGKVTVSDMGFEKDKNIFCINL